ncbi:hypothetical protein B0J18DRAFT_456379 [Chaetomium sp. MPI-SDFR-AT-0129]|nr:hypothetical protein B0J18DRAFT_456379 [Chaetomium sp. MPI-SDFR-AT-0129]
MVSVRALVAAAAFLAPALAAGLTTQQIVTGLNGLNEKAKEVKSTATPTDGTTPKIAALVLTVTSFNAAVIKFTQSAAESAPIQDQAAANQVADAYHQLTGGDYFTTIGLILYDTRAVAARDDTPSPEAALPNSLQVTRSSVGHLGQTLAGVTPPSADKINADTQHFQQTVDQATGKVPNPSV